MRGVLIGLLVLAGVLVTAGQASAQSYACQRDWMGNVSCDSGAYSSTLYCGQPGLWGDVSCPTGNGTLAFTWPQDTGYWDRLLQPTTQATYTPSFTSRWLDSAPASSCTLCGSGSIGSISPPSRGCQTLFC